MDYQSNSKKQKEKIELSKVDKKIEKVITGDVVQKPKGIGRKFKETFFGGDGRQVGRFLIADVLLPAMRNLLVDAITKGAEGMIYGEKRTQRRDPRTNYGAQYSVISSTRNPFTPDPRSPLTSPPRGRLNRREINDVILSSRQEAELVVERLTDILENYDVASLADLYDLLGLETSHIDNKWGWTYINNVPIRQIRQGYLLELPPLEEI